MILHAPEKMRYYLQKNYINWEFNPPTASHMVVAWERQIRTVRKVFTSIVVNQVLGDVSLGTLFSEVEFIVNSRPLTKVFVDPNVLEALTPVIYFYLESELTL